MVELDTDSAGFAQGAPLPAAPSVVVELSYDCGLTVRDERLVGATGDEHAAALVAALDRHAERLSSRFPLSASDRHLRAANCVIELAALPAEQRSRFAHAGFLQLTTSSAGAAAVAAAELGGLDAVWRATVAPDPVPAGALATAPAEVVTGRDRGSRNLEPAQGYLHAAPAGIDARAAWDRPGGRGAGVRICDIEANWSRSHDDLPRGIAHIGGLLHADDHWRNHGTAVLGVLCAQPGVAGVHGICPEAEPLVQSAFYGDGLNTARAIGSASGQLEAGDIILIEIQSRGPTGRYVAMTWWDDVHSAVLGAIDAGIVVVVAAGNGAVDFDSAPFDGSNLQKDSGAIVVGAVVPPSNIYDVDGSYLPIGPVGTAMPFSNHGSQVRLGSWGWHVTTLGYGDAQGGSPDRWATLRFSGTSSATPIVAGAAACLQGISRDRFGQSLTPAAVRRLLIDSGTPLGGDRHVGRQPDLRRAVAALLDNGPS